MRIYENFFVRKNIHKWLTFVFNFDRDFAAILQSYCIAANRKVYVHSGCSWYICSFFVGCYIVLSHRIQTWLLLGTRSWFCKIIWNGYIGSKLENLSFPISVWQGHNIRKSDQHCYACWLFQTRFSYRIEQIMAFVRG